MKTFALILALIVAPVKADTTFLRHGTFPMHCTRAENGVFELLKIAKDRYSEIPNIVGEMGPGLFVITYNFDEKRPSWSVIITKPGEACFFASGTTLSVVPNQNKPAGTEL